MAVLLILLALGGVVLVGDLVTGGAPFLCSLRAA
jgi:hypothetical protein